MTAERGASSRVAIVAEPPLPQAIAARHARIGALPIGIQRTYHDRGGVRPLCVREYQRGSDPFVSGVRRACT